MDAEILIPISLFASLFGIFYLYFITRHRERLSLIEKGVDASLFHSEGRSGKVRRMVTMNVALTLIGIGAGLILGVFLYEATGNDVFYPACMFVMAGVGLLTSVLIGKKMEDKAASKE